MPHELSCQRLRIWGLIQYKNDVLLVKEFQLGIKIKQSHHHLIFIMGIPILEMVFVLKWPQPALVSVLLEPEW